MDKKLEKGEEDEVGGGEEYQGGNNEVKARPRPAVAAYASDATDPETQKNYKEHHNSGEYCGSSAEDHRGVIAVVESHQPYAPATATIPMELLPSFTCHANPATWQVVASPQSKQIKSKQNAADVSNEEGDEDLNKGRRCFIMRTFHFLQRYLCFPFKHLYCSNIVDSYPLLWYLRLLIGTALVCFAFMVLILWFGMLHEQAQVRKGQDMMSQYYQTPHVCTISLHHLQQESQQNSTTTNSSSSAGTAAINETFFTVQTLNSVNLTYGNNKNDTTNTTTIVAHCGDCGQCSNPHDISIYDQTKNSLYQASKACARQGILGGRAGAKACMLEQVGMTSACTDCWVDNIMCDLHKCVFSCFFYTIFRNNNRDTGSSTSGREHLNPCTQCDEVRCGPQFITCAGVNRRRAGILSDIERDNKQVCHDVNPPDWWNDELLQQEWDDQQQRDAAAAPGADEQEPNQRLRYARSII